MKAGPRKGRRRFSRLPLDFPSSMERALSAVRSREAEALRLLADQWVSLALTQDKAKLMEALNESTAFEAVGSRDLLHFLALAGAKLPALQAKGAEIASLVTDRMLIKNSPVGDKFKNAGGLAVYLPAYGYDSNYSKLIWAQQSKWDDFVRWLIAK